MSKLEIPCPTCAKWVAAPRSTVARPPSRLERISRKVAGRDLRSIEVAIAADTPTGIRQLALDPFLGWLASYAATARFSDGQTLQLGWSLLSCRLADGRLTLLAPDMQSFPIEFQPDLTDAVWALFEPMCVVLLFVPYLPALQDELARRRKPPE